MITKRGDVVSEPGEVISSHFLMSIGFEVGNVFSRCERAVVALAVIPAEISAIVFDIEVVIDMAFGVVLSVVS